MTDGEDPYRWVMVCSFDIDATIVTNAAFAPFIEETGYETKAERFGSSAVFHLALDASGEDAIGPATGTPWWAGGKSGDGRLPGGRRSNLDGLEDHPVVHVSWNDVRTYCTWAGHSIPTEAQGEYAACGGVDRRKFPWGNQEVDEGGRRANIWQGDFPRSNAMGDGYLTSALLRSLEPNGYGLWQAVGHAWDWCEDWFHPGKYQCRASAEHTAVDPLGPAAGHARILRGGSYLCHDSYCIRYRNCARPQNTRDSSMGNAGFRTVSRRSDEA